MPSGIKNWQYAALSEIAYRRDENDQRLRVAQVLSNGEVLNLTGTDIEDYNLLSGDDGFIINPENGLTAYVVQVSGRFIIVFRGTDSSSAADEQDLLLPLANGSNVIDPESGNALVDGGDWSSNVAHVVCSRKSGPVFELVPAPIMELRHGKESQA